MKEHDKLLVRRLVHQGDAEAFSTIMGEYAGMVYNTSRRVLGNDAQAADVVQETFYQFLKNAGRISGSVSGWLHQVATRRALDLVRQNASRRRREQLYAASTLQDEADWEHVEPIVDEALDELPDELREVVIRHYLQGKTMGEIAADIGLSQPTVSRRVTLALEHLRQKLRARGVVVTITVLAPMLSNSAVAIPATVLKSLGKMGWLQASLPTAGLAGAVSSIAPMVKLGLAIGALALATGSLFVLPRATQSPSQEEPITAPVAPENTSPSPPTPVAAGTRDDTQPTVVLTSPGDPAISSPSNTILPPSFRGGFSAGTNGGAGDRSVVGYGFSSPPGFGPPGFFTNRPGRMRGFPSATRGANGLPMSFPFPASMSGGQSGAGYAQLGSTGGGLAGGGGFIGRGGGGGGGTRGGYSGAQWNGSGVPMTMTNYSFSDTFTFSNGVYNHTRRSFSSGNGR